MRRSSVLHKNNPTYSFLFEGFSFEFVETSTFIAVSNPVHLFRRPCIILPYVACLTIPYLSPLSHQRHDFRKIKLYNIKLSATFSETFVIIKNVDRSSYKVTVILIRG